MKVKLGVAVAEAVTVLVLVTFFVTQGFLSVYLWHMTIFG